MSEDISKTRNSRQQQDFDDLQNEISGADTGRIQRFGIAAARDGVAKQDAKRDAAYRDALHRLLMTDPEYRQLYEELGTALGGAETTADSEIAQLENQLNQTQFELEDMRNAAPKINGKAIFKTANGRVMDEEGNGIEGLIAQDIVWPPHAVSAEDYLATKRQEADLTASLDAWQGYRNDTLGDLRNRYEDGDNPMSKDDMRDALERLEASKPARLTAPESHAAPISVEADAAPNAFPELN